MSRVLITGGSGFFGAHLIRELLPKNYAVRSMDVMPPIHPKADVEFILADIRDKNRSTTAAKGIDIIFHNAAILPISRSQKNTFWETNVHGTKNILDAALENGVKKVVFISSSAPYGIPKEIPITEKTPFNPICDYGRSKIAAEKLCCEYRKKGLNIIILRPRTIVDADRLGIFQILYNWIADNKNVYIIGKGDNLLSLLSAKDLAAACLLAIEKNCLNEDFNLGADRFNTVRQDLNGLINTVRSRSKIIAVPALLARSCLTLLDIANLIPLTAWHYKTPDKPFYFDITKAKNILEWQPKISNLEMLLLSYYSYLKIRTRADNTYGTTHTTAVKQKILRFLKIFP